MDIDRFRSYLQDSKKSQEDLMTMRENAITKNEIEHIRLAENVLDQRFPNWRTIKSRRGGSKPTDVMFSGKDLHFDSEKDAYIWLMERFTQHYPKLFAEINWETAFVAKGKRALYFAKSLENLFRTSPEHTADNNKYHCLTNGWYAKLVLSEVQKVDLLFKFATMANLRFGEDWDWNARGRNSPQISADELLRELENAL
jgi:hypothetical protein